MVFVQYVHMLFHVSERAVSRALFLALFLRFKGTLTADVYLYSEARKSSNRRNPLRRNGLRACSRCTTETDNMHKADRPFFLTG